MNAKKTKKRTDPLLNFRVSPEIEKAVSARMDELGIANRSLYLRALLFQDLEQSQKVELTAGDRAFAHGWAKVLAENSQFS